MSIRKADVKLFWLSHSCSAATTSVYKDFPSIHSLFRRHTDDRFPLYACTSDIENTTCSYDIYEYPHIEIHNQLAGLADYCSPSFLQIDVYGLDVQLIVGHFG
jgi:hypothetical protein